MRVKFSPIPGNFYNFGLICCRSWEEKKSDINAKETPANFTIQLFQILKIYTNSNLSPYIVKIERSNLINREDFISFSPMTCGGARWIHNYLKNKKTEYFISSSPPTMR